MLKRMWEVFYYQRLALILIKEEGYISVDERGWVCDNVDFINRVRGVMEISIDKTIYVGEDMHEFSLYLVFKRIFDFFAALFLLIVFSPLMFLIAIAIKFDSPGPVIYKQSRLGRQGRIFTIYKFRSMRRDAEKHSGAVWAMQNDPRVTRIGRFLRATHLDELPQLFNVLKGDMSLVGPRPERPEIARELVKAIPHYYSRLKVKPGITGLAQVRYRYDSCIKDVKNKLRYDLFYISNANFWLDLRILFDTIEHILLSKGV